MKRIVLLSPAHPLRGGIASSSERLAQALQESGYEVIVYSFSLQYPGFLFPGKTQFSSDPAPVGLEIISKVNSISPFNWINVGQELNRRKPDLIICRYWLPFMGPSLGTILRLAKRNQHTKILGLVDNAIPHEKRPGDQQFTNYFIGACDAFVVMSKSVGEDIRTFNQLKPISYNPHPLYDNYGEKTDQTKAKAKLGLDAAKKYILFFGFIRDYKGLDLLLQAMADPRIHELDIHLIIAGEYYGKQAFYENLIAELNIQDRVIPHTQFIPHESVKYYFGAADLVVQPYRSATQSGISQMAYHFDKPMVVTKVGGLPEIVPHGEVGYVAEINPISIADAIFAYFSENKEVVFTTNIQARKQQFSWSHMVETVEQSYAKIYDK